MMVRRGDAGGAVAGAFNTTGDVLRAAFQVIGTAPGMKTVSSVFLMVTKTPEFGENGTILFADCAVNPNPDAQALAEIALATARSCKSFLGVEARVAMLSFSTKGSASHEDADKVLKALRIARGLDPALQIDGELQADAALLPKVGAKKAPDRRWPARPIPSFSPTSMPATSATSWSSAWPERRRSAHHPGPGQAGERSFAGLLGGRHRQRGGDYRRAGAGLTRSGRSRGKSKSRKPAGNPSAFLTWGKADGGIRRRMPAAAVLLWTSWAALGYKFP